MKIKLVRTGGFIPVRKEAEADIQITNQEIDRLLDAIQADPSDPHIRDGHFYELKIGESSVAVDIEKVPAEFKEIFSNLKSQLKFIK